MQHSPGELQVVGFCCDRPQQCVSPGSRPSRPACGGSSAWHSGAFVFPLEQHQRACSAYRAGAETNGLIGPRLALSAVGAVPFCALLPDVIEGGQVVEGEPFGGDFLHLGLCLLGLPVDLGVVEVRGVRPRGSVGLTFHLTII